jgi:hypothetical protein
MGGFFTARRQEINQIDLYRIRLRKNRVQTKLVLDQARDGEKEKINKSVFFSLTRPRIGFGRWEELSKHMMNEAGQAQVGRLTMETANKPKRTVLFD